MSSSATSTTRQHRDARGAQHRDTRTQHRDTRALLHRLYRAVRWLRRLVFRPKLSLGVRALLINASGNVCLVRHTYQQGWFLPGGGVKVGESLGAAMSRELVEETGLETVETPQKVHGVFSSFRDKRDHHVVVFVVNEWTVTQRMSPEIAEVGFFAPSDLPSATSPATTRRVKEYVTGAPRGYRW